MKPQQCTTRIVSLAVAFALSFTPASWAQNSGTSQNPANPAQLAPAPQSNSQDSAVSKPQDRPPTAVNPQASGTTVNPSQPPLQPVTTYPDAAGNPQKQMDAGTQTQPATQAQPPSHPNTPTSGELGTATEPQGAATAEKVPTAGGAAAKPAGAAIAPAKQRQARSLLIKLGAVAAGAVAAGTIYALSKGTPSVPPGAGSPGAVQKR